MCDKKSETISHIVRKCKALAQKEYKKRHDDLSRIVHWKLCGKYNLKRSKIQYEHAPEDVIEGVIVIVNENKRSCTIIDIVIPGDIRVSEKDKEKIERYQELKREI